MKFNLLTSVSSLALGGMMIGSLPEAARATLTCTAATFSCTETVDLGSTKTNFSLTATLDQFNPGANQHLTSVVIAEGGTLNVYGGIRNTGDTLASFSYAGGVKLTLSGGTGAPSNFPSALTTTTNVNSTEFTNIGVGATASYSTTGGIVNASRTLTSGLGGYVGSGTFQALVTGSAHNILTILQGNAAASVTTYADPFVTLTYHYSVTTPTPNVPEPASLAMLGAGLTGVGVLRRRRKA